MTDTPCVCPVAGYCATHRRDMVNPLNRTDPELRWRQCRTEPGYFEALQKGAADRAAAPAKPPSPTAARLAACRTCDRYLAGPERCGVLVDLGKPGLLMHSRGIPNPTARCPLGRWPVETPAPADPATDLARLAALLSGV